MAAALDVSRRYGADSIEQYSSSVLGLLELSANRPERAVVHLDECAQHRERFACELPTVVPWQGDAIEAMIRVGRQEEALRELARLEASGGGLRFAAVVAARCRGLLSEDEADYEARFAEALELGRDLSPLEQARTELCLGMRRRRSRRRSELARRVPKRALDVRELGRRAMGRAGARRAPVRRREADGFTGRHTSRTHRSGAPGRPHRRRGCVEQGCRGRALPQPEDDRVPPRQRVSQARLAFPHGARPQDRLGRWTAARMNDGRSVRTRKGLAARADHRPLVRRDEAELRVELVRVTRAQEPLEVSVLRVLHRLADQLDADAAAPVGRGSRRRRRATPCSIRPT